MNNRTFGTAKRLNKAMNFKKYFEKRQPTNPIRYLILTLVLLSTLSASPAHPPLVPNGESYDDVANFKIGAGHSWHIYSVAFSPDGSIKLEVQTPM